MQMYPLLDEPYINHVFIRKYRGCARQTWPQPGLGTQRESRVAKFTWKNMGFLRQRWWFFTTEVSPERIWWCSDMLREVGLWKGGPLQISAERFSCWRHLQLAEREKKTIKQQNERLIGGPVIRIGWEWNLVVDHHVSCYYWPCSGARKYILVDTPGQKNCICKSQYNYQTLNLYLFGICGQYPLHKPFFFEIKTHNHQPLAMSQVGAIPSGKGET